MTLTHKFARAYATAGIPIFPLNGKQPATRHGFKDATTDLKKIDHWWGKDTNYNIGLPVPKGCVVLDIDPRAGGQDNLNTILDRMGDLPLTTVCVTGRGDGGKHYYFKNPYGKRVDRNLPDGIDIRLGGYHYVVVPPSVHPDTGGYYYWDGPEHMTECPGWLIDNTTTVQDIPTPSFVPLGGVPSNGLARFVAELQEGQRNHGLFWAVCSAIEGGTWSSIKNDIKDAARSIGLPDREIETTAASAERRMS